MIFSLIYSVTFGISFAILSCYLYPRNAFGPFGFGPFPDEQHLASILERSNPRAYQELLSSYLFLHDMRQNYHRAKQRLDEIFNPFNCNPQITLFCVTFLFVITLTEMLSLHSSSRLPFLCALLFVAVFICCRYCFFWLKRHNLPGIYPNYDDTDYCPDPPDPSVTIYSFSGYEPQAFYDYISFETNRVRQIVEIRIKYAEKITFLKYRGIVLFIVWILSIFIPLIVL